MLFFPEAEVPADTRRPAHISPIRQVRTATRLEPHYIRVHRATLMGMNTRGWQNHGAGESDSNGDDSDYIVGNHHPNRADPFRDPTIFGRYRVLATESFH